MNLGTGSGGRHSSPNLRGKRERWTGAEDLRWRTGLQVTRQGNRVATKKWAQTINSLKEWNRKIWRRKIDANITVWESVYGRALSPDVDIERPIMW